MTAGFGTTNDRQRTFRPKSPADRFLFPGLFWLANRFINRFLNVVGLGISYFVRLNGPSFSAFPWLGGLTFSCLPRVGGVGSLRIVSPVVPALSHGADPLLFTIAR